MCIKNSQMARGEKYKEMNFKTRISTCLPFFVTIISLVNSLNFPHNSLSSRLTLSCRSVGSPFSLPTVISLSTALKRWLTFNWVDFISLFSCVPLFVPNSDFTENGWKSHLVAESSIGGIFVRFITFRFKLFNV